MVKQAGSPMLNAMIALVMLAILSIGWLPQAAAASPDGFDWQRYDAVLKTHVRYSLNGTAQSSYVDYQALQQDKRVADIDAALQAFDPSVLNTQQRLGFYINAYNFFAMTLVAEHDGIDSIRDIGSWLWPVWKRKVGFIHHQAITLEQIEHRILRPMGDARIHFALVCASLSCPNLRNEAYRVERLEQQLDEQTRVFLQHPSKGLNIQQDELYLSKIFDWFAADFGGKAGVIAFVRRYSALPPSIDEYDTLDYDWSVNNKPLP